MRFFLVLAVLFIPSTMAAQIPGLDKVFANIEDVNASVGFSRTSSNTFDNTWLHSVTFEVTLYVASGGCKNISAEASRLNLCEMRRHQQQLQQDSLRECEVLIEVDSTAAACRSLIAGQKRKATSIMVRRNRGDSVIETTYLPVSFAGHATMPTVQGEIGLAYGQLSGFQSLRSGKRVSGTIEEFPQISGYLDLDPEGPIVPYFGVRAGLAKFSSLHAYGTADSVFTGTSPATYLLGGVAGIGFRFLSERLHILIEADATYRRFADVTWAPAPTAVSYLPRGFELFTFGLSAGIQLGLKN
jgi:hypothetical protein